MTNPRPFKASLARVRKLWKADQFDEALELVEELRHEFPGNPQLQVAWASLVQLQESAAHGLDEARAALESAVEFDDESPTAQLELAHFVDAVDDDAAKAAALFAAAATRAKAQLLDALVGRARALIQLNRRPEAIACLTEALYVSGLDPASRNGTSTSASAAGLISLLRMGKRIPEEVERLLDEALAQPSR